jgi:hypothetical protein
MALALKKPREPIAFAQRISPELLNRVEPTTGPGCLRVFVGMPPAYPLFSLASTCAAPLAPCAIIFYRMPVSGHSLPTSDLDIEPDLEMSYDASVAFGRRLREVLGFREGVDVDLGSGM